VMWRGTVRWVFVLLMQLLIGLLCSACADSPDGSLGSTVQASGSEGDRGYSKPVPRGPSELRGYPAPFVEAFPAVLSVVSGMQVERSVWIINNEESPIHLSNAEFSCGCLDGGEIRGVLDAYAAKEVKILVAAVEGSKGESVCFPFKINNDEWELRIVIERH
jgi:hypothetical protein